MSDPCPPGRNNEQTKNHSAGRVSTTLDADVGRDVIFPLHAPTTGAQQCESCGGWIMGANHFWVPCWDGHFMRMCRDCYDKWLHQAEANEKVEAPK